MALSAALALGTSRGAAQGETRWIHTASVTPLGDDVYRVWERSVSRTSSELLVLARAELDCRLRLTRVVAVVLPGFAPVQASEQDSEWTEIPPGSSFEAELRQVCAP